MSLPKSREDREYKKFVEDTNGDVAIRTVGSTAGAIGGTSGASGLSVFYAKPSGTNADATVSYTSSTTITVTGLSFTFTKYDIESIERIPASGDSIIYSDKTDFSVSSGVITVTGASFDATDNFIVKISGDLKTIDTNLNAQNVNVVNGDSSKYTDPEHLIDETNEAVGSYGTITSYAGYRGGSVDYNFTGSVSAKVYLTNDTSADATSTANWTDFTAQLERSGASTLTGKDMFLLDTRLIFDRMMIWRTTTTTTNASSVYIKRGN